ncbi:RING1 and YY1-binding protein A [Bagarius yarrelli]|uniref:RING1 and YY1-binding protein A n=1 Tax=Bagarius yarrelli TaxID=175774 RepID=A0A556VAM6_BAGYA|nr:RING1 and YY1-binding protein A [Bagarius yarrelli]
MAAWRRNGFSSVLQRRVWLRVEAPHCKLLQEHSASPIMGDKKSPSRPKRHAKPCADDGFWDCSVCTFRNSAEAFKCSMCDVRKGTSTRKPRLNSQLVAQQVAQQYATPPPAKKDRRERSEREDHYDIDNSDSDRPSIDNSDSDRLGPDSSHLDKGHTHKDRRHERIGLDKHPLVQTPVERWPERAGLKEELHRELMDKVHSHRPHMEKEHTGASGTQVAEKEDLKKGKVEKAIVEKHKEKEKIPNKGPPSERSSMKSGKSATKSNKSIISRPKLKNIDRSSAQQLAITVGNVTVIITDFKEKTRSSSTSSSTATSSSGSFEQQHLSSSSESTDRGSSRASTPRRDLISGHNELL